MRSYEAARSLFSFFEFLSWCVIVLGVVLTLGGFAAAGQIGRGFGGGPAMVTYVAAFAPGASLTFAGFMGLVFCQIGRAGVDSAEYSQQMLKVARDQLEVSRQSLRAPSTPPNSFAATAKSTAESDPPVARHAPKRQHATRSSEPKLTASGPQTFRYRTKDIQVENGKFLYNGIAFDSREKAERYIDTFAGPSLPKPDSA